MKLYFCPICKNLSLMLNDSGVKPHCCGKEMVELKANTTDAATEKHVPVVNVEGNVISVQVGSVLHPMTAEHHIAFIVLVTDKGYRVNHLDETGEPKTRFTLEKDEKALAVYEYCNLHGLWKVDL